jgi:hypothetical protein
VDLDRLPFAPKITAAAASAVLVLVLFELIARFGYRESPADRNAFGYSRGTSIVVGDSVVSISSAASRRLWSQRYPIVAPPGTRRIVLVGDSAARGPSLERSVSEALRSRLRGCYGIEAEVWNLSSPGYGSRRKAVIASRALEFHPDLIVYNAGVSTEYEDSREWERYLEYHSWHPRHWVDQLPFLGRVKLSKIEKLYWEWVPEDVRNASLEEPLAARIAAIASKSDAKYWTPLMLANLDGTTDEVLRSGARLVILVRSHFDFGAGRIDDSGLDEAIGRRYGERPGVAVVSERALLSPHLGTSRLFNDTSHWTDAGKDVIAQGVADSAARLLGADGSCR